MTEGMRTFKDQDIDLSDIAENNIIDNYIFHKCNISGGGKTYFFPVDINMINLRGNKFFNSEVHNYDSLDKKNIIFIKNTVAISCVFKNICINIVAMKGKNPYAHAYRLEGFNEPNIWHSKNYKKDVNASQG